MPPHVLLTSKDRALPAKASSLLEEIVETMQVQEDKEAMQAIKQADKDVKAKKTRAYDEFKAELRQSGRLIFSL